jgi:hypothetical protein
MLYVAYILPQLLQSCIYILHSVQNTEIYAL